MVYYQQQNVALLAQISMQVSSIAPQVSIPATPPPPYPDFTPNPSDVRVNAFWFMSLVFSLSAALLATLVQRWARDYMRLFERHTNPLKSARLRQYLSKGTDGWYVLVVAKFLPGLVHASLFLFFLGLSDSLFSLNTTIGIATIVPITICGFLYVFRVLIPVMNPQAPFQNSFSSLIWYLRQKVYPRSYVDRAPDGARMMTVSSSLYEGQLQLAMEENEERKHRDAQAIQWLIDMSTDKDEMDSFLMAIPSTFSTKWGIEVWRKASEGIRNEGANLGSSDTDLIVSVLPRDASPVRQRIIHPRDFRRIQVLGTPYNDSFYYFCKRLLDRLDIRGSRSLFASDGLWRKRARAYVQMMILFALFADVELEVFGDLGMLLLEVGNIEDIRGLLAAGTDGPFVTHWTCLSLLLIPRWSLRNNPRIVRYARRAIDSLSGLQLEGGGVRINIGDTDEKAIENARTIDDYFETASEFYVHGLSGAFSFHQTARTEKEVRDILARDHEANVSMLERIAPAVNQMEFDKSVSSLDKTIGIAGRGLNAHIPGVSFDKFKSAGLIQPEQFFNLSDTGKPLTPQFIFLRQRLEFLCSFAPKLRDIIDGRGTNAYKVMLESLKAIPHDVDREHPVMGERHVMERQLWRLQDLRDGCGFGYSVERFFLALAQLLSMAPPPDIYIGTFRVVTSNWRQHRHSIGTQRVILNIICDMAFRFRGFFSGYNYPVDIIEELLVLLGNMIEGQSGSHIDEVIEELNDASWRRNDRLADEAIKVISRSYASYSRYLPFI